MIQTPDAKKTDTGSDGCDIRIGCRDLPREFMRASSGYARLI
ncbi:hypothetical protein [Sporolactobacillus vineae]|nr:hypothetical protein [Sporolactobacillus vineae]